MRRHLATVLLGAALLVGASNPVAGPVTFTLRIAADITSLDWTTVSGDTEDLILKNIMEGLMELGPDGKARPRLAETFTVSPDGLSYTFHLRHGVKWSDGHELVAADFVESWKRLLSPSSISANADALNAIAGASEYRRGALTDFAKTGIQTPDPHTLIVRLAQPSASFLQLLALTSAFPVRADLLKTYGKEAFAPEHLVVVGPYLVTERKPNQTITLKRNPTYFGAPPRVEQIRFSVVADDSVAVQLFKEGKLDLLWTTSSLEAASPPGGSERRSLAGADIVYLALDVSDYPLTLAKARQAITHAIDRSKLSEALHGPADVTDSLLPASLFADSTLAAPSFNPELARKLWKEAGLAIVTPPKLELLAADEVRTALAADFVKAQLEANLGLRIETRILPAFDYEQHLSTLTGSLFIVTRRAISSDPQEVLDDFLSDSRDNRLRWKNGSFDADITRASAVAPGPGRVSFYHHALQLMQADDAVVVPLYVPRIAYQISARFEGFAPNVFGEVLLRDLRLK